MAGARFVRVGAQFVQLLILARLLEPGDFGLMAMVTVVTSFGEAISDVGVGSAIIHFHEATRRQLSTLYWVNVLAGVFVFGVVQLVAPYAAGMFKEPEVIGLLRTASYMFLVMAVGQQFQFMLERDLKFRTLAVIEATATLVGAGVAIILGRPFTVGNTIMINDISGIVEEVKLSTTILATEDGEKITIPNKHIIGEILTNSFEYKVVEGVVGIDYSSDPERAIAIVQRSLEGVEGVTQEPAPQIGIQGFGDCSIDIGMRYWVQTHRYYQTQYTANLAVFRGLIAGGIEIPYPRRELHFRNAPPAA